MKRNINILMLILFFPFSLFSQEKIIKGKVVDSQGAPLIGVSVVANGNTGKVSAASTDINGFYSIKVNETVRNLSFNYIGMKPVSINLDGRSTIDVTMEASETSLTEVVVVGYGSQKRETLTGSVSTLRTKEIQTATTPSLAQKLQGKVAGLNIRQNSGQPGSFDNNINIRGFGTPLFVIDGIIRNDAGSFQRLNPEDIESISVLKDASAAVYGIGAANGVIIVTTKQGTRGKTSLSYNVVTGITKPTDVPKMASASQYAQMLNDANIYGAGAGTPFYPKEELQKYIEGTQPGYTNVDWYDLTMKGAATQSQHNLSVNGGGEKVLYYVGMEYAKDGGLLRSEDMNYNRVNLRSNITADITKSIRARVLIGGMYDKTVQPGENFFNIFKATRVTKPTERLYANDNPLYLANISNGFAASPVTLAERDLTGYGETERRNVQTQFELRFAVPSVENLFITGTGAFDTGTTLGRGVYKGFTTYSYIPATNTYIPSIQRGDQNVNARTDVGSSYTLRLSADYKVDIAKHNISATVVAEQLKAWGTWQDAIRYYGDFYTNDQLRFAGQTNMRNNGEANANSRISYIGRLNYAFAGKYLLEGAFNYNGSYRYHPDRRFGFFPVVSAGWRLSEEGFIKNNIPAISNLKLRASYGLIGSDQGDPFQYLPGFTFGGNSTWEFSNGNLSNGLASPAITNAFLTWSKDYLSNIAVDLSLWNGKLDLVAEVYNRERKGLLARRNVSLPNTFGASLPEENLNSNRQAGIDLVLGHTNRVGEFNYSVSGNFNFNRPMNRYSERAPFQSQRDRWLNDQTDRWQNLQRGYLVEGQFQNYDEIYNGPVYGGALGGTRELPGDFKYKDVNNDGIINGEDARSVIGFGNDPTFNYGANLSAQWKGFDLNMLFQGAAGYTMRFNEVYGEIFAFGGNTPAYFFDRWHQADQYDLNSEWIPGTWPVARTIANVGMLYSESQMWRRNASFVRLKSLEFGYTLQSKLLKSLQVQRLRVYANAFNLITITKDKFMKQFDPERSNGTRPNSTVGQGFNYPLSKNYNFGLSIGF